jgi:kynureninase
MTDLPAYRTQFDTLKNCRHLISNSLGAMPNEAARMAARYAEMWSGSAVRAWDEEWWMLARHVGDKIGRLMNAPPDTVAMQPNVTSAQAVVLSCFDFNGPRNKVVMVDAEFPSMLYLYRSWLRRAGRLDIVECGGGPTVPLERLLEAIDETTLLVPISNVFFRSAYLIDARAVIEKAHRVGAMVVLDVFQGLGAVTVDIQELGADFAVGGCLKWLCGGPGACFLYVRPDLMPTLEPRFTGWMAHESPFSFDNRDMRFTSGSYRFLNGTPIVPAFYTCQPGLDIIAEIGVDRIRSRSLELTSRLLGKADEREWPVFTPADGDHRGGTVALNIDHAEAISNHLLARDFLIDFRPGAGIRVSPHFYNTDQEIDDLIDEIEKIQASENL